MNSRHVSDNFECLSGAGFLRCFRELMDVIRAGKTVYPVDALIGVCRQSATMDEHEKNA